MKGQENPEIDELTYAYICFYLANSISVHISMPHKYTSI